MKHNGKVSGTIPLAYANKISTFEGQVEITTHGPHELIVYAYDPVTGNTGVDRVTVVVSE